MERSDRNGADPQPVLLARLHATMPGPNGSRLNGEGSSAPSAHSGVPLDEESFSAASFDPGSRQNSNLTPVRHGFNSPPKRPEPPKQDSRLRTAFQGLWTHGWLILALGLIAAALAYLYTTRVCVPLYRIQASIEVRNTKSIAHTEALAHVLQSQSMVSSVVSSLPESERTKLVELRGIPFLGPLSSGKADELLHRRLQTVVIPAAQVIDISLLSPNRAAAVQLVNGLIDALIKHEQDEKPAKALLPDDLDSQPEHVSDEVAIIDPALASDEPVSPNLPDNVGLGALAGILVGIFIAVIRTLAVNTFTGPGSVGQVLGVRELGAIPERKLLGPASSDSAGASLQMDVNEESLRYLRSSLLYHSGEHPVRFIAFTSAAPGEGKTTIVANLSISLAATGRRVLVIDGDLRRPRLHKLMQVAAAPGLADLLRRDPGAPPVALSRIVSATSVPNLYILPPGTSGNDAPELLAGQHLSQLFRELAKSFDFILIDTPPLLACSDARNYARAVEGVVLVVRSSETQKRAALVARDMLLQDGANIIGTVLTGWRQDYPAYSYRAAST